MYIDGLSVVFTEMKKYDEKFYWLTGSKWISYLKGKGYTWDNDEEVGIEENFGEREIIFNNENKRCGVIILINHVEQKVYNFGVKKDWKDSEHQQFLKEAYGCVDIEEILNKAGTVNDLKSDLKEIDRYSYIIKKINNVVKSVSNKYILLYVTPHTNEPASEIYDVIVKNNGVLGGFITWTYRNGGLNHGHYNISSYEDAVQDCEKRHW